MRHGVIVLGQREVPGRHQIDRLVAAAEGVYRHANKRVWTVHGEKSQNSKVRHWGTARPMSAHAFHVLQWPRF